MSLTIEDDIPLAHRTTLQVGGAARHWVEVADEPALVEALGWAAARRLSTVVLGGGSNVLVADRGLDALVIRPVMRAHCSEPDGDGVLVEIGAGLPWDELVAWSVAQGLAGLECLSGIPGDIGAAPIQNIGAYGQELSSVVHSVRVVDRQTGAAEQLPAERCGFGYRDSVFKRERLDRCVVVAVVLRLTPGAPTIAYPELQRALEAQATSPSLASTRATVLALRRAKSMILDPTDENGRSAGSFFVNPTLGPAERDDLLERVAHGEHPLLPTYPAEHGRTKVPAAWLIEQAGYSKGAHRGSVGISTRHALSVVNRGGATAAEIVGFATAIKERVHEKFGVRLAPEPRLLGFEPHEIAALLA